VEKAILDVKNTSWHEEFSKFRTAVKELEVMVQNLIQSAFDTVRSVDDGVMLLDVFGHFSAREAIKIMGYNHVFMGILFLHHFLVFYTKF